MVSEAVATLARIGALECGRAVPIPTDDMRSDARAESTPCRRSPPEELEELLREREELVPSGADRADLERNRLAIVRAQWDLSRALIARYHTGLAGLPRPRTSGRHASSRRILRASVGVDRRAMASLSLGPPARPTSPRARSPRCSSSSSRSSTSRTRSPAAVVLVATFASSIVQPAFGLWSDKRGAMWLLPAGVALAGVGIALAAVAPAIRCSCSPFSSRARRGGIPPGGVEVRELRERRPAGERDGGLLRRRQRRLRARPARRRRLSSSPSASRAVSCSSFRESLVAALLLREAGYLRRFVPAGGARRAGRASGTDRGRSRCSWSSSRCAASPTTGCSRSCRSGRCPRARATRWATLLLSLFLGAGAIGTLVGGPLADRFGRKPVIVGSYALTVPLVLVYILVGGVAGDVAIARRARCVIGTFGVTAVLSQEYMPSRIATGVGALGRSCDRARRRVRRRARGRRGLDRPARRPSSRRRSGRRSARCSRSGSPRPPAGAGGRTCGGSGTHDLGGADGRKRA